jgi:hypothetical protein
VVTGGAIDVGYDPLTQTEKWTKSSYWNLWSLSANRDMGLDLFISKENKLPRHDNAHELKVIIFNKHDFVLRKNKHRKSKWRFYFSSRNGVKEMTPFIVDYVMSNPKWSVSSHINILIFLKEFR